MVAFIKVHVRCNNENGIVVFGMRPCGYNISAILK